MRGIVQHIGHGATVAIRSGRLRNHRRTSRQDPFATLSDCPAAPPLPSCNPTAASNVGRHHRAVRATSVTKLLTAMTVLIAHEEGTLDLDEPIGPGDSTTTDLLAHTAGVAPDTLDQLAPPRTRRVYSTSAYDLAANAVTERSGIAFQDYLDEALIIPLGLLATASTDPPVPAHGPPSTISSG